MVYVVSDIHGEYDAFMALLDKLNMDEKNDELYVLGDCIDRGPEPIKVLMEMMMYPNIFPIIGNHEYMALTMLKKLMLKITNKNISEIDAELMQGLLNWQSDGGEITLKQFQQLDDDDKESVFEYLEEFTLFEEVEVKGKKFVLVHAGIDNFEPERDMEEYGLHELIFNSPDYDNVYFEDKYLVTGHRPTENREVLMKNNHIAIDCGKVWGGKLAAVRLDDMKVFYVD